MNAWIWWSHLERILQAFDDLGCEEFLEWRLPGAGLTIPDQALRPGTVC
jgi:hypothetical protein